MNAIEVENLVRKYKRTNIFGKMKSEFTAVDNISLQIKKGELFGLLGPNGAGKTTTIKILTTLLLPSSGRANIMGLDIVKEARKVNNIINFTFGGDRGLYWRLTGRDNLRYFADLYNIPRDIAEKRIEGILKLIKMDKRADERVENYSKGMKQRIHIGKALINDPDVIFLDEPTLGLDPVGAKDLRNIIKSLLELEKTIFLTTHYMFEADLLCKNIAIINNGKIIANETPDNLKKLVADETVLEIEVFGIDDEKINEIKNLYFVNSLNVKNSEQKQIIQLYVKETEGILKAIMDILNDIEVKEIKNREPTLEDAYIKLVGESNEKVI